MPEVEPTVRVPSAIRMPPAPRERRADLLRGLRAGVVALLAGLAVLAGVAHPAAAQGTGGANAEQPAEPAAEAEEPAGPTLAPGDRGRDVRKLQRRLRVRPVDGRYGPRTKRAVRRFQKRRGIKADGVAGPETLKALRVKVRASKAPKASKPSGEVPEILQRIAKCESGGDPKAVSADGQYRGKYQFLRSTWEAQGGEGDPAEAPEAEQDRIAIKLYEAQGTKPWPHCGAKAKKG